MSKFNAKNNGSLVHIKVVMPKSIKGRLLKLAKENFRSLNREALYGLLEHIKKNDKSSQSLGELIKKFLESENEKPNKKMKKLNLVVSNNIKPFKHNGK